MSTSWPWHSSPCLSSRGPQLGCIRKLWKTGSSSIKGAWVTFLGLWCPVQQSGWLRQQKFTPSLLEAGSPKSWCRQGLFLLEMLQLNVTPASLPASGGSWPSSVCSSFDLCLRQHRAVLPLCLSPFSYKVTSCIGPGPTLTQCDFKLTNYICRHSKPTPAHPYCTDHCSATSEQTCEEGTIALIIL